MGSVRPELQLVVAVGSDTDKRWTGDRYFHRMCKNEEGGGGKPDVAGNDVKRSLDQTVVDVEGIGYPESVEVRPCGGCREDVLGFVAGVSVSVGVEV